MTNPIDTIASAANHWMITATAQTNKVLAASLLHTRIETMITDRVLEGDDKGPELNAAIDAVAELHGPVLLRQIHDAIDRVLEQS